MTRLRAFFRRLFRRPAPLAKPSRLGMLTRQQLRDLLYRQAPLAMTARRNPCGFSAGLPLIARPDVTLTEIGDNA